LFVDIAAGLSAAGDAELSVTAGSPVAAGVFAGIAAGLLRTGKVAAELVPAGSIVLGGGWTGALF
jgi:hypothetical protein